MSAHQLPAMPWPLQVEIELTNVCNAACAACPRSDMPQYGMLQPETLERILEQYRDITAERPDLPPRHRRPRVTLAGGGEPLIHRDALAMIRRIVDAGHRTSLITNASRLTPAATDELVGLGLDGICVSFWGIEAGEYEAAMHLPFADTLAKVEGLAGAAREAGVPLIVLWVRSPEIRSSTEEIRRFWEERGIAVDTDDNQMWNRGGLLPDGAAHGHLPDLERRVWCADLFFSDAYNWNGDCLLCCCSYFTQEQIRVGNVHEHSPAEIAARKGEILDRRPIPRMCQRCRLPRDERGRWLAGPVLDQLPPAEQAMLTAYPSHRTEGGG